MSRVEKAIETGRYAIAVSGSLLRDPEVMLALTERPGLVPMALTGPAVSPVIPVGADGIARAVSQPGGVVVVVEPQTADARGIDALGKLLQRGQHRPDIIVVSRNYNPFAFGGLRGLQVAHEKGRGKAFLQGLPAVTEPPEAASLAPKAATLKKKGSDIAAPRFSFVGREDELAELTGLLGEGGPIVLSGPPGVGRHLLLEHGLAAGELTRHPDVWLGFPTGFDALISRIAFMAKEAGHAALFELMKGQHTPLQAVEAAVAAVAAPELAGHVLVVHRLEFGLGRDHDFFRKGRLELLLYALLTHAAAMPIVFVSTRQPQFHREGEAVALRRLALGGVKGRFFHEIFEAYKSLEVKRDAFGPMSDRLHGHPMAARTFAVATRVRQDGAGLVDDPKFLAAESLQDVDKLGKQLGKRVERLPKPLRAVLARIAHLPEPVTVPELSDLGVKRDERLELMSLGLLDLYGTENDRRVRVHPLVRAHLSWREISDFDTAGELADWYAARARGAEGTQKQADEHQQMRFAVQGRKLRSRPNPTLPDHDAWLDALIGMVKTKNRRDDMIGQRLEECISNNPANSDAWQIKLSWMSRAGAKVDEIEAVFEEAVGLAAVPELFQQIAGTYMSRRARIKAIAALERGVEMFPDESRLRTRLAAALLRQGRRKDGLDHLKAAMDADPMLPDAYGLLGMAKRDEGLGSIAEAEELLREAVRLAPTDAVQTARLAQLLMDQARVDVDRQKALREEAHTLLEDGIRGENRAAEAWLLLATLIREEGGDLERASWLLKQARKVTDRGHERSRRISVQRALIDMAQDRLDQAEHTIRQRVDNDPTHAEAFAALGHILEVREQFVPAHAEYMRAKERAPQNTLDSAYFELLAKRVQAIIEAQAAGMLSATGPEEPSTAPMPMHPSGRVLRRAGAEEPPEAPPAAAEAPPPAAAEAVDPGFAALLAPAEAPQPSSEVAAASADPAEVEP